MDKPVAGGTWTADGRGVRDVDPPHDRLVVRGVPVTIHRGGSARGHQAVGAQRDEFLTLFEAVAGRFRPDVLVTLGDDGPSRAAVEAMVNGIPVIGSDRGGIPEALGGSGIILPLPGRLTPTTRELPEMIEALPWVWAIASLWDDHEEYARRARRARDEARRWAPEVLEPLHERFFKDVRSGSPLA